MAYTLIRNGTLIDGTGAPPVEHAAVLLRDNRIHAVGHTRHHSCPGRPDHRA